MNFSKEQLKTERDRCLRIKQHFSEQKRLSGSELRNDMRENIPFIMQELREARLPKSQLNGVEVAPSNVGLNDILRVRYGIQDQKDSQGNVVVPAYEQYMRSMGIHVSDYSLNDLAQVLGYGNIGVHEVNNMLVEHGSFAAPAATTTINEDFRFLLPEIILEAVRTNYQHTAMHASWTATVRNVSRMEITMPHIKQSRAMPARIFEGSTVPFGSVQYGQKRATVYKIGIGLEMTEELIMQSSISDLFIFLQDVGSNIAIGADYEALTVIMDGEQTDGSESSPVIGVNNPANGITQPDLLRIPSRMGRLGLTPNRIITNEEDAIRNVNEPNTNGIYMTMVEFLNKTFNFAQDIHVVGTNRVVYLNTLRALMKLQFGSMRVRRETDINTGKERTVVTDFIGFAKVKRDASVILDGSIAYSATAGAAGAFPTYMDIDSLLAQSFEAPV